MFCPCAAANAPNGKNHNCHKNALTPIMWGSTLLRNVYLSRVVKSPCQGHTICICIKNTNPNIGLIIFHGTNLYSLTAVSDQFPFFTVTTSTIIIIMSLQLHSIATHLDVSFVVLIQNHIVSHCTRYSHKNPLHSVWCGSSGCGSPQLLQPKTTFCSNQKK